MELVETQAKLSMKQAQMAMAKAHYESNRCTKYYFQQPGRKNDAIKVLHNSKGQVITNEGKIIQECRNYYEYLYQQPRLFENYKIKEKFLSTIPNDLLSEAGSSLLGKDISLEELYSALQSMKKGAVPGEDGFTVNFYLTYWAELQQFLFDSYLAAFHSGKLSITQRRGLIRLLPKKDKNPLWVSSWRPITLLNVDYKILTKLFAKRLAQFLPDLIHEDQRGFIKHRSIHENILDVQALISACNTDSEEGMLILLDIQKAFDSVSWSFLYLVLIKYNFPESFLRWFDVFYADKELHVLNNGLISEAIYPIRGAVQGCGISPLFFVLAIEVLALSIRGNKEILGISMFKVSKKINLLADDGLLALKWTQKVLDEVISTLREFGSISNLYVNEGKSLIVPIGPSAQMRKPLENTETFQHFTSGTFRYLGIDWDGNGVATNPDSNFELEQESIRRIVYNRDDYKHTLLGRILTVKSLMVSKFTYKFKSIPSPPVAWFCKLQRFLNDYIWSHKSNHMATNRAYLPIKQGGLNMVRILAYNKSIKLSWLASALSKVNAFWVAQLQNCLKIPLRELLCANVRKRDLHLLYHKEPLPIWQETLGYWCDLHFTSTEGNVALMAIDYNSVLKVGRVIKNVFDPGCVARLHDLSIFTVKDFLDEYDDLSSKQKRAVGANQIMRLIPNEWVRQVDSGEFCSPVPAETMLLKGLSTHSCYKLLINAQKIADNKRYIPVGNGIAMFEFTVQVADYLFSLLSTCIGQIKVILFKIYQ